jgi:hypothetical protein
MMRLTTICAMTAVAIASSANGQPTPTYFGTLHELLATTIKSETAIDAVMTGEIAQAMNQQFRMTGGVNVRSEVVKRYRNKNCARLRVVITKRGVITPKGFTDANLRTEMNYCIDGSPPGANDL